VYLAEQYGGDVDHRWLDRSYHVATQDYDRETIFAGTIEFIRRVTAT
jgi:esterase/lipase